MEYTILKITTENQYIKTEVQYTFNDKSTQKTIEITHTYPTSTKSVTDAITNRGISEQALLNIKNAETQKIEAAKITNATIAKELEKEINTEKTIQN